MLKLIVSLATLSSVALGAPQSRSLVPMLDGRIVGGQNANTTSYPFQVGILRNGNHICGGGIISSNYILTVAHCLIGGSISSYSIRAGSSYRSSGGQVIVASRIIINGLYNSSTLDNDIGVIDLVSPITITTAWAAALAPSGSGPVPGATVTVAGWGATYEGGNASNILQVVQVPVVSAVSCRASYGNSSITDRMFCAGYPAGGRDACQGDSGGPAIVGGVITGLVSFGNGCARPNYPGVYTNIPALRTWLLSTTGI